MVSHLLRTLLAEIQTLSPMPGNETLIAHGEAGSHRIERYTFLLGKIQQEIQTNFPIEVISTLLASFGLGNGFEVYWTVLHLIETFPDEESLYRLIRETSIHENPGTRQWCCLLLGKRRAMIDYPALIERLKDDVPDVREAALNGIIMLSQVHALPQALPALRDLSTDKRKIL